MSRHVGASRFLCLNKENKIQNSFTISFTILCQLIIADMEYFDTNLVVIVLYVHFNQIENK